MLNVSISMAMNGSLLDKVVNKSGLNESICFEINPRFTGTDLSFSKTSKTIEKELTSLKGLNGYGSVMTSSVYLPYNSDIPSPVILTSKYLLERISMPISEGEWFNKSNILNEELPIVVGNNLANKYPIGTKYIINVNNKNEPRTCKVRVIGILKEPSYVVASIPIGSVYNIIKDPNAIIIPYAKNIFREDIIGWTGGAFLFPDKNTNIEDALLKWKTSISNIGTLTSYTDTYKAYEKSLNPDKYLYMTLGFIVLILALGGIGGNNVLSMINQEKEFAIYFLCGMKWGMCLLMTLAKDLFIITVPAFISYVLMAVLQNTKLGRDMLPGNSQTLTAILICVLIFIITSLGPLIRLYRKNPVTIIREWV
jgi:ABC-type antimicrobial peptide transport system permease subunit